MPQTTITDIARAAGVAPSTVSRALHDHPRISQDRRRAIQALAAELGYRPNQVARSLVLGRTFTLGVVVTDVTDPFVAEVMRGAETAGRTLGYTLLFAMSDGNPAQEVEAIRALRSREVDALIVISGRASAQYGPLRAEANGDFPLVLVNNIQAGKGIFTVRMGNRQGAALAASHLLALGHRRLAYVSGPQRGRSTAERREGFRSATAGVPDSLVIEVDGNGQPEDGIRALHYLLHSPIRPTAVACYNDLTALGLLSEAARLEVRVPEDLSVTGFDDIPLSRFSVPALTTVRQPKAEMGRAAVQICVQALNEGDARNCTLEGELVIRGSTGPVSEFQTPNSKGESRP